MPPKQLQRHCPATTRTAAHPGLWHPSMCPTTRFRPSFLPANHSSPDLQKKVVPRPPAHAAGWRALTSGLCPSAGQTWCPPWATHAAAARPTQTLPQRASTSAKTTRLWRWVPGVRGGGGLACAGRAEGGMARHSRPPCLVGADALDSLLLVFPHQRHLSICLITSPSAVPVRRLHLSVCQHGQHEWVADNSGLPRRW